MSRLSKQEAKELLHAVVDGEASDKEESAFFEYLAGDDSLKQEYLSAIQIKKLLAEKLPRYRAPEHLKNRIFNYIEDEKAVFHYMDSPVRVAAQPTNTLPFSSPVKKGIRYLAAAAIILFISLTLVQLLDRSTVTIADNVAIIEMITAQHFLQSDGVFITPDFEFISVSEAERFLEEQHGITLTVPEIEGTTFAGIVFTDFYNGVEVPLLEYIQPELNETIYIFAFNIDSLADVYTLKREKNAAESCSTRTDYFVNEIDGVHVVSWLWDGNWYSAVSNHNGYDLASLVLPLQAD